MTSSQERRQQSRYRPNESVLHRVLRLSLSNSRHRSQSVDQATRSAPAPSSTSGANRDTGLASSTSAGLHLSLPATPYPREDRPENTKTTQDCDMVGLTPPVPYDELDARLPIVPVVVEPSTCSHPPISRPSSKLCKARWRRKFQYYRNCGREAQREHKQHQQWKNSQQQSGREHHDQEAYQFPLRTQSLCIALMLLVQLGREYRTWQDQQKARLVEEQNIALRHCIEQLQATCKEQEGTLEAKDIALRNLKQLQAQHTTQELALRTEVAALRHRLEEAQRHGEEEGTSRESTELRRKVEQLHASNESIRAQYSRLKRRFHNYVERNPNTHPQRRSNEPPIESEPTIEGELSPEEVSMLPKGSSSATLNCNPNPTSPHGPKIDQPTSPTQEQDGLHRENAEATNLTAINHRDACNVGNVPSFQDNSIGECSVRSNQDRSPTAPQQQEAHHSGTSQEADEHKDRDDSRDGRQLLPLRNVKTGAPMKQSPCVSEGHPTPPGSSLEMIVPSNKDVQASEASQPEPERKQHNSKSGHESLIIGAKGRDASSKSEPGLQEGLSHELGGPPQERLERRIQTDADAPDHLNTVSTTSSPLEKRGGHDKAQTKPEDRDQEGEQQPRGLANEQNSAEDKGSRRKLTLETSPEKHDPIEEEVEPPRKVRRGSLTFKKACNQATASRTSSSQHQQPDKNCQDGVRHDDAQSRHIQWVQHTHRYFDEDDRSMVAEEDPSQASTIPSQFTQMIEERPEEVPSALVAASERVHGCLPPAEGGVPETMNRRSTNQENLAVPLQEVEESSSHAEPFSRRSQQEASEPPNGNRQSLNSSNPSKQLSRPAPGQYCQSNRKQMRPRKAITAPIATREQSGQRSKESDEDVMEASQNLLGPTFVVPASSAWIEPRKRPASTTMTTIRNNHSLVDDTSAKSEPQNLKTAGENPSHTSSDNWGKANHDRLTDIRFAAATNPMDYDHNEDSQTVVHNPPTKRQKLSKECDRVGKLGSKRDRGHNGNAPSRNSELEADVFPDLAVTSASDVRVLDPRHRAGSRQRLNQNNHVSTPSTRQERLIHPRQQSERSPLRTLTPATPTSKSAPHEPRNADVFCRFITPARHSEGIGISNHGTHQVQTKSNDMENLQLESHTKSSDPDKSKETGLSKPYARGRRVTLGNDSLSRATSVQRQSKRDDKLRDAESGVAAFGAGKKATGRANKAHGHRSSGKWISNKPARDFIGEAKLNPRKGAKVLQATNSESNKTKLPRQTTSTKNTYAGPSSSSTHNKTSRRTPSTAKPSSKSQASDTAADGMNYRYKESVRSKAERECLPQWTCDECGEFFGAILNQGNAQEVFNQHQLLCNSRHRERFTPPETPPGFWELSFQDEKEMRERDGQGN